MRYFILADKPTVRTALTVATRSLLLPPEEELDKIMRYETHLERQFQWKLQQLMSWRKVRIDVPDAETWER